MSNRKKNSSKEPSEDTKIRHAIDFIEELSWLLESKNKLRLDEAPTLLRKAISQTNLTVDKPTDNFISPNPNIHYLIGVLPRLFDDKTLFEKNEDIISFAKELLEINITRPNKRSRYELIGLISCECNKLDDSKLNTLVDALSKIANNAEKLSEIAKKKNNLVSFSWNETIRQLGESYE